jgi:hypothetical protein
MKLRIQSNSLRLRLNDEEVIQLGEVKRIEESIKFGTVPDQQLVYSLIISDEVEDISAKYLNNRIMVLIPRAIGEEWINTEQITLKGKQTINDQEQLRILIEKDFDK